MADPVRAALRVARAHLTDDGLRALAHAMRRAATRSGSVAQQAISRSATAARRARSAGVTRGVSQIPADRGGARVRSTPLARLSSRHGAAPPDPGGRRPRTFPRTAPRPQASTTATATRNTGKQGVREKSTAGVWRGLAPRNNAR